MPLRVTHGMMQSQLLRNIGNNVKKMSGYENQLSTGRKLNKPSDDPVGITYALRYRSDISMNEQYKRNIDVAKSLVEHTDTVLDQVDEVIQRANELATRGVSGTNPQSALDAISKEMGQIYEQLVMMGNDNFRGKYIFNGQKTDEQPYTVAGAPTQSTDGENVDLQFAAGVTIPVNITGNEVFGSGTEGDNLFKVVKGLEDAFASGQQEVARGLITDLTNRMDKFLQVRAEVGARANRIDLMDKRLVDLGANLEELSGKTEDADYAETIIKLKQGENVYQASLSTGAKIIQPSLVDFLR